MRYAVTALFDRPVGGLVQRDDDSAYGKTPESAARGLLHRLSEEEREATVRVIVAAPSCGYQPYPVYRGAVIEFERVGGKLVEVRALE